MTAAKTNRFLNDDEVRQLADRVGVDHVVTTVQAAALLQVAPQTLRKWACEDSGPLKPRRMFGRLRWAVADIKRLLASESAAA
jgi:hypothetical protein